MILGLKITLTKKKNKDSSTKKQPAREAAAANSESRAMVAEREKEYDRLSKFLVVYLNAI